MSVSAAISGNSGHEVAELLARSPARLSREEALLLLRYADFFALGAAAREERNRRFPADEVSYTSFRVINYTNYCNVGCTFCSFMDEVGSDKGYTLSEDDILKKTEEAVKLDTYQVFFQGGVNPDLPFAWYLQILRRLKAEFPFLHIRAFSPVEVLYMEKITGLSLSEVFAALMAAGMDSFPGAGAEILTERMRNILSPAKASTSEWTRAMVTAGESGMKSSANIVWGSEETDSEIIEHLGIIRDIQDKTGSILSFIPWTFQRQTKRFHVRHVPSQEYLRVLALTRLFLDNVPHIEASIMVAGKQLGEMALQFGADDINSPVIEENVLRSFGLKSTEESERFIREAGFKPVRRNFLYERDKKH